VSNPAFVRADDTRVFVRELDRAYPLIERGEGSWLFDTNGVSYLDATSGGAMVTSLGHGNVPEIIDAARQQAQQISFIYNVHVTSPAQEALADELLKVAPQGFSRVHFTSGGTEANELGLRMVRSYHVEKGDDRRQVVISPAQSYHGASMATFGLTGRQGLQAPYEPYIQNQAHIPPSTWLTDPTGETALQALDEVLERVDPTSVAAFLLEPVSAASLPGYTPPPAFWAGLEERRQKHGFLIWFDEVVTGLGRTGSWFAANRTPVIPDVITTAKGLGAGFIPVGGMLVAQHVYDAVAQGSRSFEPGHTWDGAPVSCAVGLAVLKYLKEHRLVEHVAQRGPVLLEQLREALAGCEMVREVRGQGYLLGISYVDPRDGKSLLDPALRVAEQIDQTARDNRLIIYSTQPTRDGFAGDQTLIAPTFVATDEDLNEIVDRVTATVMSVEQRVKSELMSSAR
jgi:adenosylmethionine-8-amino-7-oxononanoate aminotransferase